MGTCGAGGGGVGHAGAVDPAVGGAEGGRTLEAVGCGAGRLGGDSE